MSGYVSGITPGMQWVAVNGAKFSLAALEQAVRHTKGAEASNLPSRTGTFRRGIG